MRRRTFIAAAAAGSVAPLGAVRAQGALPKGNLRIIVGYPAGGSADIVARMVADKVRESAGQPVVVENKAGGSGLVGIEALKQAPNDGSTISLVPLTNSVLGPMTNKKLTYDFSRDFVPVAHGVNYPLALSVSNASGVKSWPEFVAWAKVNPKLASFGTAGAGGLPHFFGIMLGKAIGQDLLNVPYKGGAPLANDLVGGQIPIGINVLSEVLPFHAAGKLKVLGISSAARNPGAPGIPTFIELGYKDVEGDGWFSFYAPGGTSKAAAAEWAKQLDAALKQADVREKLQNMGFTPGGGTPADLERIHAADVKRWTPIVKDSGFTNES